MNTRDAHKTLDYIKTQYDKFFPGNAFESFFLLFIIAFITVSIQSMRAALANPVKALRSE
jgi:hypothetical protein